MRTIQDTNSWCLRGQNHRSPRTPPLSQVRTMAWRRLRALLPLLRARFFSIRLASPAETESAIVTLALWIAQSASTFRDAWSGGQGLGNTLVLFLTFVLP